MRRPVFRYGLQAMRHMQGTQRRQGMLLTQAAQRMQQHQGIQPAGQRHTPARRATPGGKGLQEAIFEGHGAGRMAGKHCARPVSQAQ
ncbi:hypothetical protein GCM10007363_20930 [Pseudomonas fluvialis]|uniref:Uncharacterized protein n=1 Tax=Pseudomonas fluvialis TaxID=1793966 RepID=A0ABQ2AQF3_9PSED|nr:hypothetical protein GCM10007363_20930 [Pseudomonas fluvialis]